MDPLLEPRRAGAALATVLLAAVAAACAPARSSDPAPPAAPAPGGVLRLVQERPKSLDPALADSVYESLPVNQIFDGLVAAGPDLNPLPALAETWTLADDGVTYVFELRPGAKFHDGSTVGAADVVFTLHRLLAPERGASLVRTYLMAIDGAAEFAAGRSATVRGISATSPRAVRIRLTRLQPSFLEVLTMDGASILPRHVVEALGDERFGRAPVGTGPFRVVGFDRRALRLAAWPDHFRGRPRLDAVEIAFLSDGEDDQGRGRFERHEVDAFEVPEGGVEGLEGVPGVEIDRYPEVCLVYLGLNVRQAPLDRVEIRRAIAHAVGDASLTRANGIVPPGMSGYSPVRKVLSYDPPRARQLLAAAGYPGGAGLPPIEIWSGTPVAPRRLLLETLRRDLAAVGIRAQVREVDWSTLDAALEARAAQAFVIGWVADLADPAPMLRALLAGGAAANYGAYDDPRTDELLERLAYESNPAVRAQLGAEIERHVLDQAPIVPLYHPRGVLARRARVRGLRPGMLGLAAVDLGQVWLDDREGGA